MVPEKVYFVVIKSVFAEVWSCLMDMLHVYTDNINILEQKLYFIYVATYICTYVMNEHKT